MGQEKIFRKIQKFFDGVTVYDVLMSIYLGMMILCVIALIAYVIYASFQVLIG